ncbi:hypothetical protein CEXT_716811 [Caerostris extrusa]|uniref:Uncharacterized protein n=1 Tax=Caerostris extrusa TaxID=172846 RepID=A0AAV4SZJ9_CAEEX|nr:hypothetical protein CEXT_716811 [Caerostris extrusa]
MLFFSTVAICIEFGLTALWPFCLAKTWGSETKHDLSRINCKHIEDRRQANAVNGSKDVTLANSCTTEDVFQVFIDQYLLRKENSVHRNSLGADIVGLILTGKHWKLAIDSEEAANIFIKGATKMMAEANFELRGGHQTETDIVNMEIKPLKILGFLWDSQENPLFCDVHNISLGDLSVSRQIILSIDQQVFGPIGFSYPFTHLLILYLQENWEERISGNSELLPDIKKF